MEFKDVVKERYSCKKYDSRQISDEQLAAILEAGRLAPTAKNLQEQRIYVLQSPEALAIVDELTPCRYGAPTVIAVAYRSVFVARSILPAPMFCAETADTVASMDDGTRNNALITFSTTPTAAASFRPR